MQVLDVFVHTGCKFKMSIGIAPKLMDEMLRKLTYDFVLSSSMVPPIYRKIHRTLDTKIFDYKNIKNMDLS